MRRVLAVMGVAGVLLACARPGEHSTRCDLVALDIRAFSERAVGNDAAKADALTKAAEAAGKLTDHERRLADALSAKLFDKDYATIYSLCRAIETGRATS